MSESRKHTKGAAANRRAAWLRISALLITITLAGSLITFSTTSAQVRPDPVRLQFDPHFILQSIAREMNIPLSADVPLPQIFFESTTPLRRFQDALAAQWGFVPDVFSNAYAAQRNEIYLTDDAAYYARLGRTLDDSLAHELAHYLQVRYLKADLADPTWENDAVAVQGAFRDAHAPLFMAPARVAACSPGACAD
jgi:hypothetical protein